MISSSKAPTAGLVGAVALLEQLKPLVSRMIGIALVMKVWDLFQGSEAIKDAVVGINWYHQLFCGSYGGQAIKGFVEC